MRDRLSAAEIELCGRLSQAGVRPFALVLSRFGSDFLGCSAPLRWPCDRVPGLLEVKGPGQGALELRTLGGRPVLFLEWEVYPGHEPSAREEAFPVWLASRLGLRLCVHLGAAQSLVPELKPGDVPSVRDHIRWGGEDPLRGWPAPREGARFPQMDGLYDSTLVEALEQSRRARGAVLPPAAVALVRTGPSGATAAERAVFRCLGAQVVLEGSASEAIAARHAGLRFASLALVLQQAGEPGDPGRLAEQAEAALPELAAALEDVVQAAAATDPAEGSP